jgi:murein DD-endopeptidase MepM/ murein hydrolase activator NlpD
LLIIRSEENFAEKARFYLTGVKLLLLSGILLLFLYAGFHYLTRSIMSFTYDRTEVELELTNKLIELTASMDSLAVEVEEREQFLKNLRLIANGGEGLSFETEQPAENGSKAKDVNLKDLNEADKKLRKEFERETQSNFVTTVKHTAANAISTENRMFFTPVSGIVSADYDASIKHYGVDVVAKKDEPVKAIAEGTVILSSWTDDTGYVIAIQHDDNIISIYKHNASLLKKVGSFVKAGEIISIIGNTGELTTGPHLHLEMWHNGNPVNPQHFINF